MVYATPIAPEAKSMDNPEKLPDSGAAQLPDRPRALRSDQSRSKRKSLMPQINSRQWARQHWLNRWFIASC
jgi:hypothetical protein